MSHFARVEKSTNKVTDVVVATQAWVSEQSDSEDWFQTSYNESDGKPFAAVGSTYDKANNLFIPVQPIESTTGVACTSWVWDSTNYKWKAPVDRPSDYNDAGMLSFLSSLSFICLPCVCVFRKAVFSVAFDVP